MKAHPRHVPLTTRLLVCLTLGVALAAPGRADYLRRYATLANGAMTLTGNTLGLDKNSGQNRPGTSGSIGAFITTDLLKQVTGYPAGTTLDWTENSSMANLTLPLGSTVEYAELVWNGSYVYGGQNVEAFIDNPVTFTTPAGSFSVSPDPATKAKLTPSNAKFYVRSAEVTSQVAAAGPGSYVVGGVPATVAASENNYNVAGWALIVVYANELLPPRNMTVFVGAEFTDTNNSPRSMVRGFCTPSSGAFDAKLMVASMEGDATHGGDEMRFAETIAGLGNNSARVSGPRNPVNNFFAGQITDDDGNLDISGSFGTSNHTAGSPVSGGRQGWDVISVNASAQMTNGQTQAFVQGTSTLDVYVISLVGLQIDVGTPVFIQQEMVVDKPVAVVGDTLTYTSVLENEAGSADAMNVIFRSSPPPGTSFIPGTVTVNGTANAGNVLTGVLVGDVAEGDTITVTYQAKVNAVPLPPAVAQWQARATYTYQYESCPDFPINNGSVTTNTATTTTPTLSIRKWADTPAAFLAGETHTYTIEVKANGTYDVTEATLQDTIPAALTYLPNTTTMNGDPVPDVGGQMPFETAAPINAPGKPAGHLDIGDTAMITFQVTVNPNPPASVENVAYADPDGPSGPSPAVPGYTQNPLESADLWLTKTHGATNPVAGGPIEYVITVHNDGPNEARDFVLVDYLPSGVLNPTFTPSGGTYDELTGRWTGLTIPVGGTATLTIEADVDPSVTGSLVNTAQVDSTTSPIGDPNDTNNTATDTATVDQEADLSITKTDGKTSFQPGDTTTYLVTVSNDGPSTVRTITVLETLPPELEDIVIDPSEGFYNDETGLWTGLNLMPGGTATLSVQAKVKAGTTGTVTNTVTVSTPAGVVDPDGTNNTATDTNVVGLELNGTVYADLNHNERLDGAETGTGVTGLHVKLINSGGTAVAAAAVNAGTGKYQFTGIAPGTWKLILDDNATLGDTTAALPTGWVGTEAPQQTIEGVEVVDRDLLDLNFGLYQGSRVDGTIFADNGAGAGTAHDGLQNGDEPPLAGVTVKATSDGGTEYDTAETDADGRYTLYLPPTADGETVWITETNLPNYVSISGDAGTTAGAYDVANDRVSFTNATGTAYTGVNFGDVPATTLAPDGQRSVVPGTIHYYPHEFIAGTAGAVTFTTASTADPVIDGWTTILWRDVDGDGVLDPDVDTLITGPITVAAGEHVSVLIRESVPVNAPVGATNSTVLSAEFAYAGSAHVETLQRTDVTTVADESGLTLAKAVDNNTAKPGDTVTYTITYRNDTGAPITDLAIHDRVPTYTTLIAIAYDPLPDNLTGCTITAPNVGEVGDLIWQFTGSLQPGSEGTVTYQVQLDP